MQTNQTTMTLSTTEIRDRLGAALDAAGLGALTIYLNGDLLFIDAGCNTAFRTRAARVAALQAVHPVVRSVLPQSVAPQYKQGGYAIWHRMDSHFGNNVMGMRRGYRVAATGPRCGRTSGGRSY